MKVVVFLRERKLGAGQSPDVKLVPNWLLTAFRMVVVHRDGGVCGAGPLFAARDSPRSSAGLFFISVRASSEQQEQTVGKTQFQSRC